MIPTFKPLNQRSNLNFSYLSKPPKHKTQSGNAYSIFLTQRREGTKARSFLFYASFEGNIIPTIKPLNQRSNLNLSNLSKPPKH
jgi:hypothetical protein